MRNEPELALIYQRYAPIVFRRARQILGSEVDAGEVVQDVFLSLLERPAQYGGRSSITTFLYRMTALAWFATDVPVAVHAAHDSARFASSRSV
ncbi:MAG: hypothetical protein JW940_26055, partial [Polyangiaceae bacterium]|nr:hypothetical protein [Polyangiaceae bacterium]